MLKTIFAVVLAGTLLIAGGTAAYNTFQAAQAAPAESSVSQSSPITGNAAPAQAGGNQPEWAGGSQMAGNDLSATPSHTPQAAGAQNGGQGYGQQAAGNAAQAQGAQGQGGGSGNGYQGGRNPNFQGGGNHNQSGSAAGTGNGTPQATAPEWVTLHGTVSDVTPMDFLLTLDDGSALRVDSGNQYFLKTLGLTLQGGENVTIIGYWMETDFFVAAQITPDGGTTYVLRDEFGRPLWSGGSH